MAHNPDLTGGSAYGLLQRRRLIDEAAALFDREGYHRATVEDIAEAAGMAKPTLYHYFRSKHEILFEIHDGFIDPLIAQQNARLTTPMTAEQRLLEIIGDIFELIETKRGHVRVFFEHHRELPAEQRRTIAAKRDEYQALVERDIARGVEEGSLRPLDVHLSTLALFGMCNWAYQWLNPHGERRAREIAYLFWDIFLNGIAASPPESDFASGLESVAAPKPRHAGDHVTRAQRHSP